MGDLFFLMIRRPPRYTRFPYTTLCRSYATRASRATAIAAARTYGVPVRCRHLQTPTNEAYANITLRMLAKYGVPLGPNEMKMFRKADPNLPPPQALAKWLGSFEPPYVEEGFAAVDVIAFERRIDPAFQKRSEERR